MVCRTRHKFNKRLKGLRLSRLSGAVCNSHRKLGCAAQLDMVSRPAFVNEELRLEPYCNVFRKSLSFFSVLKSKTGFGFHNLDSTPLTGDQSNMDTFFNSFCFCNKGWGVGTRVYWWRGQEVQRPFLVLKLVT